jgi:hypothetical protein
MFLLCSVSWAQLTFDSTENISSSIKPHQKSFKTSFTFKNTGKKSITIKKIQSSCDCTIPALKKRIYNPGESGQIDAELNFGTKKGKLVKKIYVHTTGDETKIYPLSFGAVIPESLKITPRFLRWSHGAASASKNISIKVMETDPVTITKVTCSDSKWQVVLITEKEGRDYRIKVTPPDTTRAKRAVITIQTDYPKDKPQTFRATARVAHPIPAVLKKKK